jgi:hypothetical protein
MPALSVVVSAHEADQSADFALPLRVKQSLVGLYANDRTFTGNSVAESCFEIVNPPPKMPTQELAVRSLA